MEKKSLVKVGCLSKLTSKEFEILRITLSNQFHSEMLPLEMCDTLFLQEGNS